MISRKNFLLYDITQVFLLSFIDKITNLSRIFPTKKAAIFILEYLMRQIIFFCPIKHSTYRHSRKKFVCFLYLHTNFYQIAHVVTLKYFWLMDYDRFLQLVFQKEFLLTLIDFLIKHGTMWIVGPLKRNM